MYPTLPLVHASIRDLCEATDFLMTELEYGDKIYPHNTFPIYTFNGESLILVDTSVPRTIRIAQTPNIKRSVVIKDATGNAGNAPIIISIAQNTTGDTTIQGLTEKEFQLYIAYGAIEFTANGQEWVVTVPRSTCLSTRGFRLPQNLNLALPPAYGSVAQRFPALVYFPARMAGADVVPAGWNGLCGSVNYYSQLSTADTTASLTALFAQPDPPPSTAHPLAELVITVDTTWAIPADFPSLAAANAYLADKQILPDVTVTLTLDGDAVTGLLNFEHPQASQIIIQGQPPVTFEPESTSIFQAIPGAVLVDITMIPSQLAQFPVGSYITIDNVVGWPLGNPGLNQPGPLVRWTGTWPVVAHVQNQYGNNARIQITDWGPNFPTNVVMVPKQCRWRSFPTVVQVSGPGSIQFYSDGYTFNNVLFLGQSLASTGLTVHGILNLNDCAVVGFTWAGIYGGYRAVIFDENLFLCSNEYGIVLQRGAIWEGDLSPSNTTTYVTGNSQVGVISFNSQVAFNPLLASGNGNCGVWLDQQSFLETDNSKLIYNKNVGLYATAKSLATGQSNTMANNQFYDVAVADDGLVKMVSSSVLNLGSPNNQMNPDGSRIELSGSPAPAPSSATTAARPVRRERRQPGRSETIGGPLKRKK